MDFLPLARAAKWALDHPRFKQPPPDPKPGEWVSWVERDEERRVVKLCFGRVPRRGDEE